MFSVKQIVLLTFVGLTTTFPLLAQESDDTEFIPSGEVFGKIFTNFNTSLSGPDQQTAFEVRRAYLGYEYQISKEFSAEVKIDIGSPNDASQYSLLRRFGYFKTAKIQYNPYDFLELTFGLQDATQYKLQDSFWKRRYINESLMGAYKYGSSADIGAKVAFLTDLFDIDIALFNGEGYSSLQNDNTFKAALGATFRPVDGLITRIYGDLSSKTVNQGTTSLFAGYRHSLFSLGGEYAVHFNRNFQKDHNIEGFSILGDVKVLPKIWIFGRFDKIESNILDGDSVPWNLAKDETAITAGIEFIPIKAIKIAANYQDHYPTAKNTEAVSAFFLNLEASF
ncbi:porin [Marinilabilia sp.]|uniref:porin n=1 Tax=Marinilabilia sp. TaxID=2021252 RepID=UPI0025B99843|nr:porin [Marinilabilia sp.]